MASHSSQILFLDPRKKFTGGKKQRNKQTVFLGQFISQHQKPSNDSVYADFKLTAHITEPIKSTHETAQLLPYLQNCTLTTKLSQPV